jgi:hypothetical protein
MRTAITATTRAARARPNTHQRPAADFIRRESRASQVSASSRFAACCRRCQLPSSADAQCPARHAALTRPCGAYQPTLTAYQGLREPWNIAP